MGGEEGGEAERRGRAWGGRWKRGRWWGKEDTSEGESGWAGGREWSRSEPRSLGTRERTDRAGHRQRRAKEGLGASGDAARPEARRKYGAMPRVWAWDGIGPCPCP